MPIRPSDITPTQRLLAAVEEAILDWRADQPPGEPPDVSLLALFEARNWLLELRRNEMDNGDPEEPPSHFG